MKYKLIALLVTAVVVTGTAGVVIPGLIGEDEIKSGFTDELICTLDEKYGITIPDDAEFVVGYNTGRMTENYVDVMLKLPDYGGGLSAKGQELIVRSKLKLDSDWCAEDFISPFDNECTKKLGGQIDGRLNNENKTFSCIDFALKEDGLYVIIHGYRPGRIFD